MNNAELWTDLLQYIGPDQWNIDTRLIASDDESWTILTPYEKNVSVLQAMRPTYARYIRNHYQKFVTLRFVSPADLQKNPALLRAALERTHTYQDGDDDPQSLAQLAEGLQPVHWLWPGWIPRGMLSLLGASPGAGKSLVALDLARRIIHGDGWPDGAPTPDGNGHGCCVIYVDAEAIPQIQNERALAWDMDRSQLYLMLPPATYGMIDLTNVEHQDHLIDMAHHLEPQLIVVDSLSSISVRGENNVEDVRALLGFLSAVAREFDAGLLLIHHLRKRAATPLTDLIGPDDFRGSGHIIAMARSVLALSVIQESATPDRNGPRRLEVVKTNLCRYPEPLGLLLEPGDPRAPTLRYTDAPRTYREPTQAEEAALLILDLLEEAGEPLKPADVIAECVNYGIARATAYRARDQLLADGRLSTISSHRNDPASRWALPEWNDDNQSE